MSVKFVLVPPSTLPARVVPAIPAVVSTPAPLTYSRYGTTPSFQSKADLVSRLSLGQVFECGCVSTVASQVIDVTDAYGRDGIICEVVEQEIKQVLN